MILFAKEAENRLHYHNQLVNNLLIVECLKEKVQKKNIARLNDV